MPKIWQNISRHWRDDANLVLGVWLFLSPWILQYSGMQMAAWNAWIMGVVVVLAAVAAILYFQEWEEYLAVLVAAWLVISPWALGFSAAMMAVGNQIVVGVLVGLLAIWSAMAERQRGMQKAA
jgi:ABC-type Co2+ transport system permease subunit